MRPASTKALCLLLSFCFLLYCEPVVAATQAEEARSPLGRSATPDVRNRSNPLGGAFAAVWRGLKAVQYHYDGQLSVRHLTDAAANVTDSYTYDAFGVMLSSTGGTPNHYLYTGEQYDPNVGFYYLRARYLSELTGRLVSPDSFAGLEYDPMTLHRYLYGNANVVNVADPSGMFTLVESLVVVGVVAFLAGIVLYALRGSANVNLAIANATKLVGSVLAELASWGTSEKSRYAVWFGVISSARKAYVEGGFKAIASALRGTITWHRESKPGVFAYVYKGPPIEIWFCDAFWAADPTGEDSQAGTVVHELSHEVHSTGDHIYGSSSARSLATSDPDLATKNADNYEYYAEGLK